MSGSLNIGYLGRDELEEGKRTVASKHILKVLEDESCWLTFDELYGKVQTGCDWISFAETLEHLVEYGKVQYILPYGAEVGYYCKM